MFKNCTSKVGGRLLLAAVAALALNLGAPGRANATELDCTVGCNFVSYAGALWSTSASQSTGTGVINSFVRIQGAPDVAVDGHNTGGTASNNELNGHLFARTLGDVPIINVGGSLYYEFLLDINQEKHDPLLALNNVQICQSSTSGTLTQADACPTAPNYTMGTFGGGADYIKMDYQLNAGSGSGDLFMYIPVNTLGTNMTNYIYLFSQFGAISGYENNDGFEEWATRICGETYGKKEDAVVLNCSTPGTPGGHGVVPEPGSLLLLGSGLVGLIAYARKRRSVS
jgi:hypothetical protein